MSNPILIEVTRGPLVESFHTGAVCVVNVAGDPQLALGDIDRPIYPRSAIKALQALPLIASGAADRFGFGDREIALACASHTGTETHVAIAAAMLEAAGFAEKDLGCGTHPPLGAKAARELWRSGGTPCQLHNNCSGKHAGMLAAARHLDLPPEGYWQPGHPLQRQIHEILCDLTGLPLGPDVMGFDGCSLPNWAMPLRTMATVFARLTADEAAVDTATANSGSGQQASYRQAFRRAMEACWATPELVAGPGRADSVVMKNLPGRVFMKTGAEGVYCGGFPQLGLGFALKIDDGTTRASAGTAMTLVEHVYPEAKGLMHREVLRSWRGLDVGSIRTAPAVSDALAKWCL